MEFLLAIPFVLFVILVGAALKTKQRPRYGRFGRR